MTIDDSSRNKAKATKTTLDTYTLTNQTTGEVLTVRLPDNFQAFDALSRTADRLNRAIANASKSPKSEQFIQMNQKKLREFSEDNSLSNADRRIWAYCLADAKYGGEIKSTQVQIAKSLDITHGTVNKSFSKLKKLKMIEKASRKMGVPRFRISPDHGIKGIRELIGTDKADNVIRLDFKAEKLKRSL